MITLYSYFRSSTAYRVRIALNLKGVEYEIVPVHLAKGEQFADMYRLINPMAAVPVLDHDGFRVSQSLAILNYIDNVAPNPPLSPIDDIQGQAYVRQVALAVATDIHPLTNLKVLKKLGTMFGASEDQKNEWYAHWALDGMRAVETMLLDCGRTGKFANGDAVSVADLCIVPQMYNMRRYHLPLDEFPICRHIEENCMALTAFQTASPEMQPDAPDDLEIIHGPHFKGGLI